MRGTWIEILKLNYPYPRVSRRPSCEGRGLKFILCGKEGEKVKSRPSCEGRGLKLASTENWMKCWKSSLMRGTWIEISSGQKFFRVPSVVPHARDVD